MQRIAFQGIQGAYSDVAARRFFGPRCSTIPRESFEEVFTTVAQHGASYGVIPIENSLAGSIHQNYDLLLTHPVHIVGELHLRIEHVLMAHPSAALKTIRSVRSHPQALAQCSRFFRRHRRLKAVPYFDTAGAAQSISESGSTDTAAIASAFAAKMYGLKILKRNLENRPNNFTRFLVIGRTLRRQRAGLRTKCSIAFRPRKNQVGILFRVLGVFALRDIDLLKIESRPDPRSPFEYLFYIDLEGSPRDANVSRALEHLQEMVTQYRLLGAYPMGKGNFYGAG